jgi:hypothetical protein
MITETETLPAKRQTVGELVKTWRDSTRQISTAFIMVHEAVQALDAAFRTSRGWIHIDRHSMDWSRPDRTIDSMKADAMHAFINTMGIRQVLSVKASRELDDQIARGDFPEFTEEALLGLLEGTLQNMGKFLDDAVQEVFQFLRPTRSEYKTNTEFEIGERVILEYMVETAWKGGYRVRYGCPQQKLRALDNVFHMLDGKGAIKTHGGPLMDAIQSTQKGEHTGGTEYFEFKCFRNHNLHLKFKRMDLVAKLNARAGGLNLKNGGAR